MALAKHMTLLEPMVLIPFTHTMDLRIGVNYGAVEMKFVPFYSRL